MSDMHDIVKGSGLFDSGFYCEQYLVTDDPVEHYLREGWEQGYDPSPKFDTKFYLDENPDVKSSGMNPFVHYILHGRVEGRAPFQKKNSVDEAEKYDMLLELENVDNGYIFISHEASQTGAPIVLLNVCKAFKEKYNIPFVIVLLSGGVLEEEFEKLGPVIKFDLSLYGKNLSDNSETRAVFEILSSLGYRRCVANTVLTGCLASNLQEQFIETVYLVHELPELIAEYSFTDAAYNIAKSNSPVVFAANYVADKFMRSFDLSEECSHIIPQGIIKDIVIEDRALARKKLSEKLDIELRADVKVVLAAGLAHGRKGTDLFLSVAKSCYEKGTIENIHFVWLGDRSVYYENWKNTELDRLPYSGNIHFVDFENDPSYFFAGSDVYLLTSREDPYPGTALMALINNVPVIMFENTGGIEEVLDATSGMVVPQFDVGAMAQGIMEFESSKEVKIANKNINSFSAFIEKIVNLFESKKNDYQVSVIIPNYNYSDYIIERLSSVAQQSHQPSEIIFLDDASTDDSVAVAEEYLSSLDIPYKIVVNSVNQGVFNQWKKGIDLANYDYVWIAEADDVAGEDFLQTLLVAFQDNKLALSYSQSRIIDKDGVNVQENLLSHTDDLDINKWRHSYKSKGLREVIDYLWYRNTIPNASACLFRKSFFKNSTEIFDKYKYCGDWALYVSLLKDGDIAFFKGVLNSFRRHDIAVTKSHGKNIAYLEELLDIKRYMISYYPIHKSTLEDSMSYLDKDYEIDDVDVNSEIQSAKHLKMEISQKTDKNKRFMFITTNDGSPTGGSEVLWIEAATELFKNSAVDVAVVSKQWSPIPIHIEEFLKSGVKVYFKESYGVDAISDFNPDLVVFSLGDQDEGSEWFEACREQLVPYVIVNQLTKDEEFLSSDSELIARVRDNYEKAEKVFFTCNNNIKLLEKRLNTVLDNSAIHYNPYHMDRDVSIPYPSTNDAYCIAVPGRLINIHKGQDIIVEIMQQDKWRSRNVKINFYGDGPDKVDLESSVRQHNIDTIIFNENKKDVLDIWRENHAILLSSRMEGVPIVLIGAMMCSRVPIVTDVGGHSELIENEKDGFIATSPTVEALDVALENAWKHREEWQEIGRKSRKRILKYMPDDPLMDFISKLNILLS